MSEFGSYVRDRREALRSEDARFSVRQLAARVAADHLGMDREGLVVERAEDDRFRDALGPPHVLHDGVGLDLDLSLSHDGPWVAVALLDQSGGAADSD